MFLGGFDSCVLGVLERGFSFDGVVLVDCVFFWGDKVECKGVLCGIGDGRNIVV